MNKKNSMHDSLVRLVEKELIDRGYDNIHTLEEYHTKRSDGEVDLYTIKDNYILNFEMKCTNCYKTRQKVLQQLNRTETTYFPKKYRVFNFFVYWNKNKPVYEWIKHYS